MNLALADPPYLGCCAQYDHYHGEGTYPFDGRCWNEWFTHELLLKHLDENFDGWAYCLSSPSLDDLIPLKPRDARVGSWSKSFAAYKANVRIAYTWEPIFFKPGRDSSKAGAPVGRDHLVEPITLQKGFTGAKPARWCRWVLDLMGYVPGDEVVDLFPGTGVMSKVLAQGVLA